MRVSGCTYLRYGVKFGYPFVEAIRSVLPIVDEFIVALGPCDDGTEEKLRQIGDAKIRIVHTQWNEHMTQHPQSSLRGFVYGQQRSIALFNCTGDWAFYIDSDELVHEDEREKIRAAMEKYQDDPEVEALVFDYIHFYGNANTYAWSPRWYRTAARIVRNTVPFWTPKGMAFVIVQTQKRGRYPRAAHTGATIYHYGWVRGEAQLQLKQNDVLKFGRDLKSPPFQYEQIDPLTLRRFTGTHPEAIRDWLPPADGVFEADPDYRLTSRDRKHRMMLAVEERFGMRFNKKHYHMVR